MSEYEVITNGRSQFLEDGTYDIGICAFSVRHGRGRNAPLDVSILKPRSFSASLGEGRSLELMPGITLRHSDIDSALTPMNRKAYQESIARRRPSFYDLDWI